MPAFAKIQSITRIHTEKVRPRWAELVAESASDPSKSQCFQCYLMQNLDMRRIGEELRGFLDSVVLSRGSPFQTWITYGFVHVLPTHLLGNMAALWIFGYSCVRIPTMSASNLGQQELVENTMYIHGRGDRCQGGSAARIVGLLL